MAEAFEQGGDAGEAVIQGIDTGQDSVELVGDAALFIAWRNNNLCRFKLSFGDVLQACATVRFPN
ncbi:hypothetical protein P353_04810 [Comamonas testosteroni]|uniref:Uncharacterized protein n=1 Tax=Comamonas testosteroni TaxID=285 RepID=A0A096HRN9_COMTE|nr:hypothetical protein P353_04810 [Comamonas testosteroni]